MFNIFFRSSFVGLLIFSSLQASAETWVIDSSHSRVGFEVEHMMITTVKGQFGEFSGVFETNSKNELISLSGEVSVVSVDTNDTKRDGHLQTPDFFKAEAFPVMKFSGSKVKGSHAKGYTVEGNLTIRDVTKSVTLSLSPISGPIVDGWGNTKIGTTGSTTINRKDFGVNWNNTLDEGGLVVGEEVRIILDLQLVKKKEGSE